MRRTEVWENGERWNEIPGYGGRYLVSNRGRVRTRNFTSPRGRMFRRGFLKQHWSNPGTGGRLRVSLFDGGQFKAISVHRLVLLAFRGPCPAGMEGCHNDGNPANNHLFNLRWDTPESNWADRKAHGRDCIGTKNGNAVLSESDVLEIRKLQLHGLTPQEISVIFANRCSRSTVYGVATGKTYKILHSKT